MDSPVDAFSENVSSLRFVAFDTETTGAAKTDHLVEIAAVSFDEDFEHRRFEALIRPPIAIPAGVIAIHGITDEMVAECPAAGLALDRFFEFLGFVGQPRVLVAHNAGFDVGMVHNDWKRAKIGNELGLDVAARRAPTRMEWAPEVVIDSCMLAKTLLPELPHHRLEALARHLKIETGRMHRAMEDVRVLQLVFMRLLGLAADRAAAAGEGLTLLKLIDLCGGYYRLSPDDAATRANPFCLPPRLAVLESLCTENTDEGARVAIAYETDEDYRYITPMAVRLKGFKVYVEAFCHRDNIKKTFRADRIVKVGRIEQPC